VQLEELIARIQPLDEGAMQSARLRQDRLTKPQGSLGRLEELSILLAGMTADPFPSVERKSVIVMAADHGVTQEGVSAYPAEVTTQMIANFLRGGAAINVLARQAGAQVLIVDMGVAADVPAQAGLIINKIAHGSGNIAKGAAMTREQAAQSIFSGAQIVEAELRRGADVFATGDMGIGNTTPSAAIACALMSASPAEIAGRGTGLDDDGYQRKLAAIERALAVNVPDAKDGLDVLAKVGGFEIGGLAGVILAAAAHRKPVIVDGFISTAAAMLAVSLAPQSRAYLIAAHRSSEHGHARMLEWLRLRPLLDFDLRLGEGSGAVLAFHLIEAATRILREMATFDEAGVSDKEK
jgi:nicotinate-nucleotide--dimethylbenzimidazole phosphoribosyltransferase